MQINPTRPIALSGAQAWRTYTGGKLLAELRGEENPQDGQFPEEWILSVVKANNTGREHLVEGLNMLADDPERSLADLIAENPQGYLGAEHVARHGNSTGMLLKLIDSQERLTIQVHPNKEQALSLFGSQYGKTECWHILGGRDIDGRPPCVYLGFKKSVTRAQWEELFQKQDIPAMLDCLHEIPVTKGDTLLIEGGVPHAIGAGCFLAEIQEPTDYTIRVERVTPSGLKVPDGMCHQGLGFERIFDCFDFTGYTYDEVISRWKIPAQPFAVEGGCVLQLIGPPRTTLFSLNKISLDGCMDIRAKGRFSGIFVLTGRGTLSCDGQTYVLTPAKQFFIPAGVSGFQLEGKDCELLQCFGSF